MRDGGEYDELLTGWGPHAEKMCDELHTGRGRWVFRLGNEKPTTLAERSRSRVTMVKNRNDGTERVSLWKWVNY